MATQHIPIAQGSLAGQAASLVTLVPEQDDAAIFIQALRERKQWAERALVEEQTPRIERILVRILGTTCELDDHCQVVLIRTFERIGEVRNPSALPAFVRAIAVNVAREVIKKRRRWRWISFHDPGNLPDIVGVELDAESREALQAVYQALDRLGTDERVVFTLRWIAGLDLQEVADAMKVSLATVKRRLQKAEAGFLVLCRDNEDLWRWVVRGGRWP